MLDSHMLAAIYARKSTDQSAVADEQKSVVRQVDHARAYAVRKGWTVAEDHVYIDDGISGAEFANRPGFLRLMASLKPRAPFQVLIMSEESRLGREAIETAFALKQIITAGVRVFLYLDDRERELSSPIEKAMLSLQTMADEMERDKARLRVTDAMTQRARAGYACGAACFGYTNVPVVDAVGRRSHVERRIKDPEAAIVRRIFDLCAAGYGYTRIAKVLNGEGAPAPRPKLGRPTAWAPSSVKEILDRRTYLGELVWNRTQKCNAWGHKRPSDRPETQWIRTAAPMLRIITDDQWDAASRRREGLRARLQAAIGNRPIRRRDVDSSYLLSGFARCTVCGGSLGVMSGSHRSDRGHRYGCLSYLKRGTTVCGNGLRLPLERVDAAVLQTLAGDVLHPRVVLAVVDGVFEEMTLNVQEREIERARAALRHAEQAIANLARAIAAAGELEALLSELHLARSMRDQLAGRIRSFERVDVRQFDRKAIESTVRERLSGWQTLLATKRVEDGRQLLREVLAGPLRFTPDERTYRFEGEASFGGVLAGTAHVAPFMVAVHRSAKGCTLQFSGTAA